MTSAVHARSLPGRDELFIAGSWRGATEREQFAVVSPVTEETVCLQPLASAADADAAVAAAHRSFAAGVWSELAPARRADDLLLVADLLEQRSAELVALMGVELGQRPDVARWRVTSAVDVWRHAAGHTAKATAAEPAITSDGRRAEVRQVPVGVALAITPWNSPLLLASMKVSAALAAGCSVVLKPAPEAPMTLRVLAEVIEAAGLPSGVVSVLPADAAVTAQLVADERVDIVSFTGSTAIGSTIAAACASRIARVVLELGGKSPAVVMPGADMGATIPALIEAAGLATAGQVCTARTRVLVPEREYSRWADALTDALRALRVGTPDDPSTEVGPLATARQLTRVRDSITIGVEEGARLACGGARPAHLPRGYFLEPTLFVDVDNGMRIAREEIFGPVVCLIGYDDTDDAVRLANDSPYGLAASVYGPHADAAQDVGRRLRCGTVHVNSNGAAYNLPFGGMRRSGLGRECGVEGIRTYLESVQLVG